MIGLLCGTAVGAAIGLLLAPKSGAELRTQLADSADRLRRKAGETYDQASGTVNDLVDRGKSAMDDVVDKGRDAVRQGREKFDEARSEFKSDVKTTTGTSY
ncbi:MAG: YtxH domain-containing protein [Vicinamibacterales bacterium]